MRGFGDIIGYQQSGEKFFKIADPVAHKDLFIYAESYMKKIENQSFDKFDFLIRLYERLRLYIQIMISQCQMFLLKL